MKVQALNCSHGIGGNLLKLMENYLTDRKQRVVLNGQLLLGKIF